MKANKTTKDSMVDITKVMQEIRQTFSSGKGITATYYNRGMYNCSCIIHNEQAGGQHENHLCMVQ